MPQETSQTSRISTSKSKPRPSAPISAPLQNPKSLDVLVFLTLCLVVLLFLWPAVLPGRVLMPLDLVTEAWPPWQRPNQPAAVHNPLISDVVDYIYPVKQFAADSIREGVLPLWNPYVLGGYPFTYNSQAGLFYPLSALYYLLPGPAAVDLTIFGQLFLGITFMYLYLRRLGIGRPAAAFGTLVFSLNGLMVAWLEWQVVHAAIIWLPLQLYLVERLVGVLRIPYSVLPQETPASPNTQYAIRNASLLLAIAFALPWLGGHWNWTLYGSLTVVAYLFWRLRPWLLSPHASRFTLHVSRFTLHVSRFTLPLFILATGLALCLVQVLPAANYLRQSHRQALPFAESLQQGLLNRFVTLVIPNFFGNPVDHNWWGPVNYNESAWYIGILPLFLALLLPFLRRDTISRFFLAWGGLGLLWALGTPAYGLLYVLPVFNGLLPSRAAILVVFCAAVLSALAFDQLSRNVLRIAYSVAKPNTQYAIRNTVIISSLLLLLSAAYLFYYRSNINWPYLRPHLIVFVVFWLASVGLLVARLGGRLSSRPFAALALTLLAADLFMAGYGYNTISSSDQLYPPTETGRFLLADPEPFRIASLPEAVAYPPNTSLVVPLENMSGYEPGIMRRVVNYIGAAEGQQAIYFERELMPLRGLSSPLIDLLNVKYVVTIADWHSETPAVGPSQPQLDEWLLLTAEASLGQSFVVADAGLHRIDLRLRPVGEAGGTITVRVLTADGGQELAHATLPSADLDPAGWNSFYFEAFPSEWGRQFRFTVEAGERRVELGASATDSYPQGESLDSRPADLTFTVYYLPRPQLAHEDGKTRIYLNEGYFPRAFAVPQAVMVDDEEGALAAVLAHREELDQVVVLELEGNPTPPDLGQSGLALPGAVTITNYGFNQVELTADLSTPAFIILADSYYPGWQATLDGRPVPVYRADSILRAVYAPAGRHDLVFTFRPLDFTIGAIISAAAWLMVLAYLLLGLFRKVR